MSHLSLAIKQFKKENHVEMGEGAAYGVERANANRYANMRSQFAMKLAEVNKELWIILTLLLFAAVMNYVVASHRMILSFYFLPTLFAAYVYGRRHAVLTAFASSLQVGLLVY